MNSAGRLAAVVVTHNRLSQLKTTLGRLLDYPVEDLPHIIIVNNASIDGTTDWLAAQTDPRLEIVYSVRNLGGAGGFEMGMQHAAATHDPDWMIVMDDDARPEADAIAAFHATAPSDAWAVAAAVFHPDGRVCDINRPSINPFWHRDIFLRTALGGGREAFHLGAGAFGRDAPVRDVDAASFVGLFVARAGWQAVGFPDGRLFIYGDDVLYTLGLRRAGGRIVFMPAIRFEHDFSTITQTVQRFRPLWKVYYHYRNLLLVYRRAAGVFFWPALLVILPKWLFKVRQYDGERRAYLSLLGHAVRDGLLRRTDVAHEQVLDWAARQGR
jgi:GT2 family glycosyltransferase